MDRHRPQPLHLTRRAAVGALAAGAAAAVHRPAHGREITLRWWSPQAAPAQVRAYRAQIAAFEAANPGFRVVFETTSDEGYAAQLAAAFSSGEVPDLVTHLPSFAAQSYYANGLLEPFGDVIDAIGADDFYPGANAPFRAADGQYVGTGVGNSAVNILWIRKDLMARAGVERIPETWDGLRDALRAMQGRGIYGAPYPYGRNSMTSLIFTGFIHQAGGQVFTPDLEVAIDSEATRHALEFYRELRDYCPRGATNYSWGQSLMAFVSGATATGIYTGRVLSSVRDQNPPLAGKVTCGVFPRIDRQTPPWTFNDFPSVFIPSQSRHKQAAKRLAVSLFQPPGYVEQLHAAPGHVLPVLRSINESRAYRQNDLIEQYAAEVDLMARAAAAGKNLGYESAAHKPNVKAGEVIASNVIADLVQRVILNRENVDAAIGRTARAMEGIMAS